MVGDLISRSALLDEIYGDNHPTFYDGADVANWQMYCINCAPAVEAEPVRYGQWMDTPIGTIECSECGCAFNLNELLAHYCPNCGKKMRGNVDASE